MAVGVFSYGAVMGRRKRRKTFRVPLHCILLKPNIPAGMSLETIASKTKQYRTAAEDEYPCLVKRIGTLDGQTVYRLMDGRHRYFSAVIAGRVDLLCMKDEGA